MKKLFENWRQFTEQEEEEITIITAKGEVSMPKDIFDKLISLAANNPQAIQHILDKAKGMEHQPRRGGGPPLNKPQGVEDQPRRTPRPPLKEGIMQDIEQWTRKVGLGAALAALTAISAGNVQAGETPQEPPATSQQAEQNEGPAFLGTVYYNIIDQLRVAPKNKQLTLAVEGMKAASRSKEINVKTYGDFKSYLKTIAKSYHNPEDYQEYINKVTPVYEKAYKESKEIFNSRDPDALPGPYGLRWEDKLRRIESFWNNPNAVRAAHEKIASADYDINYELDEVAPPGKEHVVKALKKKTDDEGAYAIAWSQHNKEKGKDKSGNS